MGYQSRGGRELSQRRPSTQRFKRGTPNRPTVATLDLSHINPCPAAVQRASLSPQTPNPEGAGPLPAGRAALLRGFHSMAVAHPSPPRASSMSCPSPHLQRALTRSLTGLLSHTCGFVPLSVPRLGLAVNNTWHGLHGCLKPGRCPSTEALPCLQPGCAGAGGLLPAASLHPHAPPSKRFLLWVWHCAHHYGDECLWLFSAPALNFLGLRVLRSQHRNLLPANLEEALGTLETACDQPCSPL